MNRTNCPRCGRGLVNHPEGKGWLTCPAPAGECVEAGHRVPYSRETAVRSPVSIKLDDPTWAEWRAANPDEVARLARLREPPEIGPAAQAWRILAGMGERKRDDARDR